MTQIDRQKLIKQLAREFAVPLEVVQIAAEGLSDRQLQGQFRKELADYSCFNVDDSRNDRGE